MKRHLERPPEVNPEDYRMYVVISHLTYLGIAVHASLIPLFYWMGQEVLAYTNIVSTLAWLLTRRVNQQGKHNLAIVILFTEVSIHTTLVMFYLGWDSGFQYYLMAGVPFILFNHKMKTAPLLLISGFLCLLFILLYTFSATHTYDYTHPKIVAGMNYANIVTSFIALTLTSYYFRVASFISEQKMELLAHTDQLTGLPNRRGIHELLETQHTRALTHGTEFSLVLGDIDHFKKINDNYGHDCGDLILKEIARLLQQRLRKNDVVVRWGGEEFLFIFPDTDAATACGIAEAIRGVIENGTFAVQDQPLAVTMTFGVAQHDVNTTTDSTLKRADAALYEGKQTGRNKVVAN